MSEKMIFCLGEGGIESEAIGYQKNNMCFNKPIENFNEVQKIVKELLEGFELTTFVKEENMTEEEKTNNENYKKTGGYLKVWNYQKAWEIFWRKIDLKTKNKFSELPNFDPEIFEKITGIKYECEESLSGKEVEVKYDGKVYKAVIQ